MHSPFKKALALFLCAQPTVWMSNAALAQTLQQGMLSTGGTGRSGYQPQDPAAPRDQGFDALEPLPGRVGAPLDASRLDRVTQPPQFQQPPVDQVIDPESYVCGPGDVLDLNFWGLQNLKNRISIDLEGRAFVPRVGFLALGGKTLSQVRAALRDSVGRLFPRLGFDVALAEPRTFLVQAVGAVGKPGSYPSRAVERVASVLHSAGGLLPHASRRRIEVRRKDGRVLPVDLERFRLEGNVKFNPFLLDGDVVHVPYESLTARVEGAVNRPGRYELTESRDLFELLALGGGLSPNSTRLMPVTVVRRGAGDGQDLTLQPFTADGQLPTFAVHQDDAIRFPSFDELQRSVMVLGAVAGVGAGDEASSTRRLGFVEGDTVRTLLERVGGVGPLADLDGSYLLRGSTSVPVDLYALVMLKDLKADRPVQLGDTLVVPFKRRSILVEGAVFGPGPYPYNPRFGVEQYLALAGGRNRFALELDEVRVVTPNGETRMYRKDLQVEPGSALVVPERNFSRSELVGIGLTVASLIISGTALYVTMKKK